MITWKTNSIPSLAVIKFDLTAHNIRLFSAEGQEEELSQVPWMMTRIPTTIFPYSKKLSAANELLARLLFRSSYSKNNSINTINIFTDGSLDPNNNTTACAIYCPDLELRQSWRLQDGSSIFTAELTAIVKAIEISTQQPCERIRIFTDSLSAVKAVNATRLTNYAIHIRNLVENANSAGTRIEIHWIPSHIGIPENEIVDRLANEGRSSATIDIVPPPSANTSQRIYREHWHPRMAAQLSNTHRFFDSQPRTALQPDPWLTHKCRRLNSMLCNSKISRRHHCFINFPKDARIILQTPRKVTVEAMYLGEFHYFRLSQQ